VTPRQTSAMTFSAWNSGLSGTTFPLRNYSSGIHQSGNRKIVPWLRR
jgi:hypothetical protein